MKHFKIRQNGQAWPIAVAIGIAALLLSLLWFRLGSLTYGKAAPIEVASQQAGHSWHTILHDPLNAPYTVVQRLVELTGHHGITSLRLVSTLFAILTIVLFYFVARQWHRTRVALLASWLFISSSWFLHVARLASPEILWLVSILALVVILTPNKHGRQTAWALPSTLIVLSTILYVPGMVWLVVAALIVQRKNIAEAWTATRAGGLRLISIAACLLVLAPLGYGLSQNHGLIKQLLGLVATPGASLPSPLAVVHNLIRIPESLLLRSSFDSVHWLGRLPLLGSFEIVMLLLGIYFYATHFRAARSRLIATLTIVGAVLVGLIGLTAISLIVPVVYLLATAGIAYILHLWLKVFPSNPVARGVGIGVIMLAILLTSIYQTRSYFVAWRYDPATAQAFQTKL